MQLQQFRVLVAVAETGSIRAAAKRLQRTQPALTKAIRLMEEELKAPLLRRTARGVVLTEYGSAALKRAQAITGEVQRLEEEIAQLRGSTGGSVRVGVSPLAAALIVPQALVAFRKRYDQVDLSISEVLYPDVLPLIREGNLDFAIGPAPPAPIERGLEVEQLLTNGLVVATGAGNRKVGARSLKDLLEESWVILGPAEGPGSLFLEAFKANRITPPVAQTKSHSLFAVLSILEQTNAFAVLPERLTGELERRFKIKRVEVRERLPLLRISLLSRSGIPLTPAAEALAEQARIRARSLAREGASKRDNDR